MNPRLPKDKSLDGVLSRNPDPPTMNAGMPRGISLDAIKTMNARKRLMDMGADEVMRLLGDTHEGDYRHLFDTETNPHAFRHGIQDAGADEIRQLLDSTTKSFDTAWELMKANTPCCPNKRMVERKDGTMRCRVCGSTDRVTKSDDKGDNAPTNPSLWAKAKSKARSKFKVYPSAYANGWAAKWYKSKGGGWKKKGKKSKR